MASCNFAKKTIVWIIKQALQFVTTRAYRARARRRQCALSRLSTTCTVFRMIQMSSHSDQLRR
jgi:hypothetical protein